MRFSNAWQRSALLNGIIYFLLGIITFLAPRLVFNIIVYLIVLYLLGLGIWQLIQAYKNQDFPSELRANIITGGVSIVVAFLLLLFAHPLISFLPFAAGLITLLLGIQQLLVSWEFKSTGWLLFSLLMIIVGIVLIRNPFGSVMGLLRIFGLVLIAFSIPQFLHRKS